MKVKAPSLLKKLIAALSSKTNELRIRMMIFFLLHKNLDKSSLTSSLHALVSQHPHHHRKKKNDDVFEEDQLVGTQEDKQQEGEEEEEERSKASLLNYNKAISMMNLVSNTHEGHDMNNVVENMSRKHQVNNEYDYDDDDYEAEEEEKHPTEDLTRSLFEESKAEMEMEMEGESGEVAVAKGGGQRMVGGVEEEEDIDQAADLFIQRFKKQMLLQKQRSLERQQCILLSNA